MPTLKEDNPFVSIVTLNWNGTDVTCEFLESSRNFTYKNYEIIVVDNGSTDDPTERILAGNYPNTRIVKSPVNLGSAGGNNFGMRHSHPNYDFCFQVNNDAEVTPDLIEKCLEFARSAGYKKVYLESMPELRQALKVYEKFGFTYLKGPMGNSGHTGCSLWMIKEL